MSRTNQQKWSMTVLATGEHGFRNPSQFTVKAPDRGTAKRLAMDEIEELGGENPVVVEATKIW